MLDCDLLAKVYINLIDQKEPTLDFLNNTQDINDNNYSNMSYFKKVVLPTKDEILKHKNYLKNNLKKIILIKSLMIKFFKVYFFKFHIWIS